MNLLKSTLTNYINSQIQENENNTGSKTIQMKIPASVFSFDTVYGTLSSVYNEHCLNPQKKLVIKFAQQAIEDWENSNQKERTLLEKLKINHLDWIDTRGNLTFYRNKVAEETKSTVQQVLILVGCDKVKDTASLEHIQNCGLDELWTLALDMSFSPWLKEIAKELKFEDVLHDLVDCDHLLKIVHPYVDLVQMAGYLEKLPYIDELQNEKSLFEILATNLNLLKLASFNTLNRKRKRWKSDFRNLLNQAMSFYSGYSVLETAKQEKSLKSIDSIQKQIKDGLAATDTKLAFLENKEVVFPTFDTADEFLDACKEILMNPVDDNLVNKLRACDCPTLFKDVLKYSPAAKPSRKSDTEVFGSPLEMVLSALWDSFDNYLSTDNSTLSQIKSVSIEPLFFNHNIPAATVNDASAITDQSCFVFEEKLLLLIGGLDEVLEANIKETILEKISTDGDFSSILSIKKEYQGRIKSKPSSTPALVFQIKIDDIVNKYIWKVDDKNAYVLGGGLVRSVWNQITNNQVFSNSPIFPVFLLKDFAEVFSTLSEEDTREALSAAISRSSDSLVYDLLLNIDQKDSSNELLQKYRALGIGFIKYLEIYNNLGLYSALNNNLVSDFINNYSNTLDYIADSDLFDEELFPLASKAFWLIEHPNLKNDVWKSEGYMDAGILSVLHPSMIEMLVSQMNYLCGSFIDEFSKAVSPGTEYKFSNAIWNRCIELATLQAPLPCLLVSKNNVSTKVSGEQVFYRIGSYSGLFENSVLLTRYKVSSEDDYDTIADSALIKKTEESKLLLRLFKDYFKVYALAKDGISIAVFKNSGIQPIISALTELIRNKIPNRKEDKEEGAWYDFNPFLLNVTFYSDTSDDSGISNWITRWQEYWTNKAQNDYSFYRCRLVVSHRMVEIDRKHGTEYKTFQSMVEDDLDADIAILYEMPFGDSGNTKLVKTPKLPESDISMKFPLLEKLAQRKTRTNNFKRSRILSNRQFLTYRSYLRYLYVIERGESGEIKDSEVIVDEEKDFSCWRETLAWCHKHTERVISLGGEIDRDLISETTNTDNERIIVGFGSGVGAHAELNYAVSSEMFEKEQLLQKLGWAFTHKYPNFSSEESLLTVKNLYSQSEKMADLSLIRTIGTTDYYSHDFFGYTMARRLLKVSEDVDCDIVFSLDSYQHWFSLDSTETRADLVWLQAKTIQKDGRNIFSIKMTVIESKMAYNVVEYHLDKAISQVTSTLGSLKNHFKSCDLRISPDSRYWWMQLYRIIATNPNSIVFDKKQKLEALENLAEGIFDITWDSSIFCFEQEQIDKKLQWIKCDVEESPTTIKPGHPLIAFVFYPDFIKEFGPADESDVPTWDNFRKSLEITICSEIHEFSQKKALLQKKEENAFKEKVHPLVDEEDDFEELNEFPTKDTTEKELKEPDNTNLPTQTDIISTSSELSSLKVLLGTTRRGERIYWDFGTDSKIINRHMLVLGASGTGKTFAIQGILSELAKAQQASLIIDYTNGFTVGQIEPEVKTYMRKQWYVKNKKLSFNPFLAYSMQLDPDDPDSLCIDEPSDIAHRIVDVFIRVFGSIGENQITILNDTIENGILVHKENYSLSVLEEDLKSLDPKGSDKNSVQGLINKFSILLSMNPFSTGKDSSGWSDIFCTEGREQITVFQLAQIASFVQKSIIEFSLWDLWNYVIATKATKDDPKVIVLDEIQNLSLAENSPVRKYLQEGRKLGLALIAATQSYAGLKGINSPEMTSLMNAGTKLFFKPTEQEAQNTAKLLYNFDPSKTIFEWASVLSRLGRGECIVATNDESPVGKYAKIIKVPSMEDRGL